MTSSQSSLNILAMCTLFRSEGSSNKDIFINYSHLAPYLNKLRFFSASPLNLDPAYCFIGQFQNSRIVRTNILFQSDDFVNLENTEPNFYLTATRMTYLIIALARYVLETKTLPVKYIDSFKGNTVGLFSEVYSDIQKDDNFVTFLSMNVSFYDAKTLQNYLEKTVFQKYPTFEEILEKFETIYGTKYNIFK